MKKNKKIKIGLGLMASALILPICSSACSNENVLTIEEYEKEKKISDIYHGSRNILHTIMSMEHIDKALENEEVLKLKKEFDSLIECAYETLENFRKYNYDKINELKNNLENASSKFKSKVIEVLQPNETDILTKKIKDLIVAKEDQENIRHLYDVIHNVWDAKNDEEPIKYSIFYNKKNKNIYAYKTEKFGGEPINVNNLKNEYVIAYIKDINTLENFYLTGDDVESENNISFLKFEFYSEEDEKGLQLFFKGVNENTVSKYEYSVKLNEKTIYSADWRKIDMLARNSVSINYDSQVPRKDIFIKDIEKDLIVGKINDDSYEFSHFEIVPNEQEDSISVFYKIRKKQTKIESDICKITMHGWKKTDANTQIEQEERENLHKQHKNIKIKFRQNYSLINPLFESEYKTLRFFSLNTGEPFFDFSGFDTKKYYIDYSASSLQGKYEYREIQPSIKERINILRFYLTLASKKNPDLKLEKLIEIEYKPDDEWYSKYQSDDIDPILLFTTPNSEKKDYIENFFEQNTLRPLFSRDRYYIKNLNTFRLRQNSLVFEKNNPLITYKIKNIEKGADKYYAIIDAWLVNEGRRSGSLVIESIKKEITMDESLGYENVNKERTKEGKQPFKDQTVSKTENEIINNDLETQINWLYLLYENKLNVNNEWKKDGVLAFWYDKFRQEKIKDEETCDNASDVEKDHFYQSRFIYLVDEKLEKNILEQGANFKAVQCFDKNKSLIPNKNNLFISGDWYNEFERSNSLWFHSGFSCIVISDPVIINNKVHSLLLKFYDKEKLEESKLKWASFDGNNFELEIEPYSIFRTRVGNDKYFNKDILPGFILANEYKEDQYGKKGDFDIEVVNEEIKINDYSIFAYDDEIFKPSYFRIKNIIGDYNIEILSAHRGNKDADPVNELHFFDLEIEYIVTSKSNPSVSTLPMKRVWKKILKP